MCMFKNSPAVAKYVPRKAAEHWKTDTDKKYLIPRDVYVTVYDSLWTFVMKKAQPKTSQDGFEWLSSSPTRQGDRVELNQEQVCITYKLQICLH